MFKVLGKLKRIITSRIAVIVLLLLLQVGIIALFIIKLSHYFVAMYGVFMIISIMVFLYVINKNDNPSYKLAWAIPILMFPLFGGIFYILLGSHSINKILLKRITLVAGEKEKLLANRKDLEEELKKENFDAFRQSSYLKSAGFPIYENTETNYYSQGESTWEAMLAELKKAKKYIFMEYFIIEAGEMWDSILAV
ncbi:MAG: PLDc N-terminal domain-containing protein, partial [Oscillospiraceae bacterium]